MTPSREMPRDLSGAGARANELVRQGVPPHIAERQAVEEFVKAGIEARAQEAEARRQAAASQPPVAAPEDDSLWGADTPIGIDPTLGSPAQLGVNGPVTRREREERARARQWLDELEPGSDLQARFNPEAYEAWREENIRQPIAEQAARERELLGDWRTPESRAQLTPDQRAEAERRRSAQIRMSLRPDYLEREIVRWAESTGMPAARVREILIGDTPPDAERLEQRRQILRDRANDLRLADLDERRRLVQKRAMARTNPLEYMQREDVDDWGRFMTASAMLGRPMSTDPLEVQKYREAARAQQEARMAMGTGRPDARSPAEDRAIEAATAAKEREANPMAAGRNDIAKGDFATPAAQMVLEADAESFDTTTGGMSWQNEADLRDHLHRTYGIDIQTATRIAKQYADKRRRWWHQGGRPAGPHGRPTAPDAAQAPAVPMRVPEGVPMTTPGRAAVR